jgi:hypothetical protein
MIEVYLYGNLIDKVVEKIPNADRIMLLDFVEGERFQDCLHRLGLELKDLGDCFISGAPARRDDIIHDLDSLELNPIEKNLSYTQNAFR